MLDWWKKHVLREYPLVIYKNNAHPFLISPYFSGDFPLKWKCALFWKMVLFISLEVKKVRIVTCEVIIQSLTYPSILKGPLAHLLGFFLELFDGTFVDAAALVDEVAGGCGLAGVHVADHHDVDVSLLLTHPACFRFIDKVK